MISLFILVLLVYFSGYCKHCAEQLTLCPVCRQLIDRYQEIIQQLSATNTTVIAGTGLVS